MHAVVIIDYLLIVACSSVTPTVVVYHARPWTRLDQTVQAHDQPAE